MRIAHVSVYPPKGEKHAGPSGVASYTKNLVSGMRSTEDQIFVLCEHNGTPTQYEENGVTIIRCFKRGPQFASQIMKELRKINPDVVHIQQELALYGNVMTAYLLQWLVLFSRRYSPVVTLHGVVNPRGVNAEFVKENNSNLPAWLVRLAFYVIYTPLAFWAKHVIVHEAYFKDILRQEYRIPAQKISVIPHGVEALKTLPKSTACRKLGLPPERDLVLFMGFATGYKGLDVLIEGFAAYAQRNPNAMLILGAGKHPKLKNDAGYLHEYERLQQKAKQLIPATQYTWRGFIPETEIREYYSACDVSIYPYTTAMSSSGPMSFAIGFKKPFLASSAFAKVFDAALLFERTPAAVAEKLADFFTSTHTYSTMLANLKDERIWPKVSQTTRNVYEEIV